MSAITKTVTIAGKSPTSYEDAIRTVLSRAAESISEITSFHVTDLSGEVDASGIPTTFDVTLEITFVVKDIPAHN